MRFTFTHWMNRQAGYEALLLAERRRLHAQTAKAIEGACTPDGRTPTDTSLRSSLLEIESLPGAFADAAWELAAHWKAAGATLRSGLCAALAAARAETSSAYVESLRASEEAVSALTAASDRIGAAIAAYYQVTSLEQTGKSPEAWAAAERAFQIANGVEGGELGERALLRIRARRGSHWIQAGRAEEGDAELRSVLDEMRKSGYRAEEAECLSLVGAWAWNRGNLSDAEVAHRAALAVRDDLGDVRGVAQSLNALGGVELAKGKDDEAERLSTRALEKFAVGGDERGRANCLGSIAHARRARGDDEAAIESYGAALAIFRSLGVRNGEAATLHGMAGATHNRGESETAIELLRTARELCRSLGNRWGEAAALHGLGAVHSALGRYAEALEFLDVGLAITGRLQAAETDCLLRVERAIALHRLGRRVEATAEALRLVSDSETGSPVARVWSRTAAAIVLSHPAHAREAERLAHEMSRPAEEGAAVFALCESLLDRGDLTECEAALERGRVFASQHRIATFHARVAELADRLRAAQSAP